MVPTKERNQMGVLLSYKTHGILFDCGEGIQRQLKIADERITKVTKILISHWHSDHVLGIPGLIQTLSASEYPHTLEIYGPKGTKKRIEKMFEAFVFDREIDIIIKEIKDGIFFENEDFTIEALPLEHGIDCLGFRFAEKPKRKMNLALLKKQGVPDGPLVGELQKGNSVTIGSRRIAPDDVSSTVPGKSMSYVTDTRLCTNCYTLAKNADILICESTYGSKLKEKADEHFHMTAQEAALLASKANAKKLILAHFSARYKTTDELLEEAKTYFDSVVCAYDLLRVKI